MIFFRRFSFGFIFLILFNVVFIAESHGQRGKIKKSILKQWQKKIGLIREETISVYAAADAKSSLMATLPYGNPVVILTPIQPLTDSFARLPDWLKIEYQSGKTGFVLARQLYILDERQWKMWLAGYRACRVKKEGATAWYAYSENFHYFLALDFNLEKPKDNLFFPAGSLLWIEKKSVHDFYFRWMDSEPYYTLYGIQKNKCNYIKIPKNFLRIYKMKKEK